MRRAARLEPLGSPRIIGTERVLFAARCALLFSSRLGTNREVLFSHRRGTAKKLDHLAALTRGIYERGCNSLTSARPCRLHRFSELEYTVLGPEAFPLYLPIWYNRRFRSVPTRYPYRSCH